MDNAKELIDMVELKKFNLLALVLNFEKYWQNYSLSDGTLYKNEVRTEAAKIVPLFYEIYDKKVAVNPDRSLNEVDMFKIRQFIEELEAWLGTNNKFPKVFPLKEYTNKSQVYFQVVFMEFEDQLEREIDLPIRLCHMATVHESFFRKKQLKWANQLPDSIIEKMMDTSYIAKMSESDSIVMVADIRRSQDLITYGLSPNYYREQIIGFSNEIRKILHDDYGIYDRFTGDGFIAYFNQYVCEQEGKDYYAMALDACERIQSFSSRFFDQWSSNIRKIPVEPIGLSIGIDSGVISFKDSDDQLLAIGDACVWATRMCSAGKRGDVVFNNIPYHRIAQYGTDGFCKEIIAETKNGESFKAYNIIPSLVKYQPLPKKDPSLNKPTAIK